MTNTLSLNCSQCGGKIEIRGTTPKVTCTYCGTEQILKEKVFHQMQTAGVQVCPVCKKDDKLEKVTAIVTRETRGSEDRSFLAKMLILRSPDYYDLSKPTHATTYVPSDPGPWNRFKNPKEILKIMLWVIGINLCYMYNYFFHWIDVFPIETFLCSGAIIFLAIVWFSFALASLPTSDFTQTEAWHKLQQSQYLEALEQQKKTDEDYQEAIHLYDKTIKEKTEKNQTLEKYHEQKLEIWRKLYYCYRDDVVCLPAEACPREWGIWKSLSTGMWTTGRKVIDLSRVCTVSVETMKIVKEMPE